MFRFEGGRPGDTRGFVHKKLLGFGTQLVRRFIPPVGVAIDAFNVGKGLIGGRSGGRRGFGRTKSRATVPRTLTARPTVEGQLGKNLGRELKFGGDVSTPALAQPSIIGPRGSGTCRPEESVRCCRLRNGDFREQAQWQRECGTAGNGQEATGVGEAVNGRYGAALEPGSQIIDRAVCLAGMQLGDDGLCYNKGVITNKQRMWPRGRRPLLTGGDMAAISTAARAGRTLQAAQKRLEKLGLMKKPVARRALPPHRHAKASTDVVSV